MTGRTPWELLPLIDRDDLRSEAIAEIDDAVENDDGCPLIMLDPADVLVLLDIIQGLLNEVKDAESALNGAWKALLTVKPSLDAPYPDDPRWTPWTRWGERAAREAHDAAMRLRARARVKP